MKFHIQEFRHDPANGVHGDCQRAVIACLLDLELHDVPNFNEGGPDSLEFHDRLDDFLAQKGFGRFAVAFDGDLQTVTRHMMAFYTEGQPYMIAGKSPRGVNHVVIYMGADLYWDTHPDGGGIIGPCDDGMYWVEILTVRAKTDKKGA